MISIDEVTMFVAGLAFATTIWSVCEKRYYWTLALFVQFLVMLWLALGGSEP